jgi:hypothetical protein
MPAKKARSAPRPPFGLPELTVAVRTSLLSCGKPEKPRVFTAVRESSGESRVYVNECFHRLRDGCSFVAGAKRPIKFLIRNS